MLPLWYAAFLLSATAHEAAHALVAYLGGDDTAYRGGQVSLNPIPHVRREPFGTVLVPLLSFFFNSGHWMIGWASAPYDPFWEDRHPRRAAGMALAGPGANLLLAAVAFVVLRIGVSANWWVLNYGTSDWIGHLVIPAGAGGGVLEGAGRFLSVMLGLNLVLFVFNLIPVWPLDGGTVLAGVFEPARRLRDWLRSTSMGFFLGILVAWWLVGILFWPVFALVVGMLT